MEDRITIRLDRNVAKWVSEQGKKHGVTMAYFVRRLIEYDMAESKPEGGPMKEPPEEPAS